MIITLRLADFSKSNIGTLSSWRITRSLGSGATYEGVTSVDKGAAFTATVTLAEGYEIGTAGVTITMSGTVLSGAHSISGNVITITIAEVTGNVVIKVPTINTATGEEEEGGTSGDNTGSSTNETKDVSNTVTWTAGGPVGFAKGIAHYDTEATTSYPGSNLNLTASDYIDVSEYSYVTMTIVTRGSTTATGGYCFYTTNDISGFISDGANTRHANGSTDGVKSIVIAIPANAKYMRTTYWSSASTYSNTPFSCILSKENPENNGGSGSEDLGESTDITSLFSWPGTGGPVEYATGLGYGEPGAGAGNPALMYSNFVDVSDYSKLQMTIATRASTYATGGYCFYTAADKSAFISDGASTRNGNGRSEGTALETITIPAGATHMRTTYWVEGNANRKHDFQCIAY